jgi:UDP-N-acetylmuramate--alanine ligase
VAVGLDLEISSEVIREALGQFSGADRRFQIKGQAGGITVVDDYGHHPTEVHATLEAARRVEHSRLVVIFQPHRYSRTKYCFEDFARCFHEADVLIVTDIYAAGEEPIAGVTASKLVEKIQSYGHKNARYEGSLADVPRLLAPELKVGDLLLTMGAGNVWTAGEELLKILG